VTYFGIICETEDDQQGLWYGLRHMIHLKNLKVEVSGSPQDMQLFVMVADDIELRSSPVSTPVLGSYIAC
jgi:hypothetical protein